jgi:hypothetical protein
VRPGSVWFSSSLQGGHEAAEVKAIRLAASTSPDDDRQPSRELRRCSRKRDLHGFLSLTQKGEGPGRRPSSPENVDDRHDESDENCHG